MTDEQTFHRRLVRITIGVVFAILSGIGGVGLGIAGQVQNQDLQDQRNADRIASDLAGCARGNVFRQQVIDLGSAVRDFNAGQLDIVLPHDTGSAAVDRLRDPLDRLLSKLTAAVAKVELVDCLAVTPGAKETP